MQTLDVISIYIWQMLVSLANLALLFWGVKKFLYKPVKKMLKARQDAIDVQYSEAENAKNDADIIVRQAKEDAELEMTKAEESIKREIVDVSTVLTSKILEREINSDDHKQIIDSFIEEIGDGYDAD